MTADAKPVVAGFYDKRTFSIQYVVSDPATKRCAIIDPVLDYDEKSGSVATRNADILLAHVEREGLSVEWILDTHPHADHFSAAQYLKSRTGAPTAIGERIVDVQALWKDIYHLPDFPANGSQWDRLFADGEIFSIGTIPVTVMHSPGHTLASITYVVGESTVAEQKATNSHVSKCRTEADYVAIRDARDRTLPMPKLILHALQVNINGGRLPAPEGDGRSYLKIPVGAFPGVVWE